MKYFGFKLIVKFSKCTAATPEGDNFGDDVALSVNKEKNSYRSDDCFVFLET